MNKLDINSFVNITPSLLVKHFFFFRGTLTTKVISSREEKWKSENEKASRSWNEFVVRKIRI